MSYNLRLYVLALAKRNCAKTYNQDYNEAHLDLPLPTFTFSKLLDIPLPLPLPLLLPLHLKLLRSCSRPALCAFTFTLTSRYIYRYAMRCYKRIADALLRPYNALLLLPLQAVTFTVTLCVVTSASLTRCFAISCHDLYLILCFVDFVPYLSTPRKSY